MTHKNTLRLGNNDFYLGFDVAKKIAKGWFQVYPSELSILLRKEFLLSK